MLWLGWLYFKIKLLIMQSLFFFWGLQLRSVHNASRTPTSDNHFLFYLFLSLLIVTRKTKKPVLLTLVLVCCWSSLGWRKCKWIIQKRGEPVAYLSDDITGILYTTVSIDSVTKILPYLPHLTSPHLIWPDLTWPDLMSLHLTSCHLTSPYHTALQFSTISIE